MSWGLEGDVIERFVAAGASERDISFVRETFTFQGADPAVGLPVVVR